MKKVLLTLAFGLGLVMASCSPSAKSVYEKIQNNEELTEADYKTIEEWTNDNAEKAAKGELTQEEQDMAQAFAGAALSKAFSGLGGEDAE